MLLDAHGCDTDLWIWQNGHASTALCKSSGIWRVENPQVAATKDQDRYDSYFRKEKEQ